jgi:hypothetical protein
MGAPKTEDGREDNERPEHEVTIAKAFSVSRQTRTGCLQELRLLTIGLTLGGSCFSLR